jgi:hypothetical protein
MNLAINPGNSAFSEEQRFRQLWIQLLMWAILLLTWGGALRILTNWLRAGWSSINTSEILSACSLLVGGAILPVIMLLMRLNVSVREDGIHLQFWPLTSRRIGYDQIARCYARSYRPILEYAGWGIKWTPGWGWAYNVRGHDGVQLELTDGKRILIGSQRSEELAGAINSQLAVLRQRG